MLCVMCNLYYDSCLPPFQHGIQEQTRFWRHTPLYTLLKALYLRVETQTGIWFPTTHTGVNEGLRLLPARRMQLPAAFLPQPDGADSLVFGRDLQMSPPFQ